MRKKLLLQIKLSYLERKEVNIFHKDFLIGFIEGLIDSDGNIEWRNNKRNFYICITNKNEEVLRKIKEFLNTLGISASLYKNNKGAFHF